MDGANQASLSDDEEDLEALRLAALQTLKRSNKASQVLPSSPNRNNAVPHNEVDPHPQPRSGNRPYGSFSMKRSRFFRGRGPKNGHFHSSRVVSSNLISLTPSLPREEFQLIPTDDSAIVLLPQDRYTCKTPQETKSDEISSKFDRYKDSDKSDEDESEEEALKSGSDDDSPAKLERSDSLEALMQELDDEIQGKSKTKERDEKVTKEKIKTKRKKEVSETEKIDESKPEAETDANLKEKLHVPSEGVDQENAQELVPSKEINSLESSKPVSENTTLEVPVALKDPEDTLMDSKTVPQLKKRRHFAPPKKEFRAYRGKIGNFRHTPSIHNIVYLPNNELLPFSTNNPPPIFNDSYLMNPPPFFERPLSPLLINAETLQTQTLAPLSPRSAAFVLENRAIIEKRKRSPRRSYSRSPSPRKRSLSPRRSPTPPYRKSASPRRRSLSPRMRSVSPRKRSLTPPRKRSRSPRRSVSPKRRSVSPKKRSVSPKRRSASPKRRSASPRRRSLSPKRRTFSPRPKLSSPKQRPISPMARTQSPRRRDRKGIPESVLKNKLPIRDRLGLKYKPDEKDNKNNSSLDPPPRKDDKPPDPILEARKKKFEVGEIKIREGVIRLKPKDDAKMEKAETNSPKADILEEIKTVVEAPVENVKGTSQPSEDDILNEDALLEDEIDLEAELDLFSDEDFGNDNEGRFQVKQGANEKPVVLPLSKPGKAKREVRNRHSNENKKNKSRERSRSPRGKSRGIIEETSIDSNSVDSSSSRSKTSSRSDKSATRKKFGVKSERHPRKFERKIEIKIKNPSKYERVDPVNGEKEIKTEKDKGARKVELGSASKLEDQEDDDETEIVVENDEDEVENTVNNEGDLRTQLSKKRAEKLHKSSIQEGVSSRLLQNALQNALPLKKSKRSKSKVLSSSDVKLPIHLRLGLACGSDTFSKPKRKSKKRKSNETEDQV